MPIDFDPVLLRSEYDYLAPDGSEIRLLAKGSGGSLCQCRLPPGSTSAAVSHKTVEELWYFISGSGQVWRDGLCKNEPIDVNSGTSIVIPVHTPFQFRNTDTEPLIFLITTIPSWPGEDEALPERGFW